jgi:LmbE family N-acetylglucosaminyl deacetylase
MSSPFPLSPRAPYPEALQRPHAGRVLALVPHADDDVLGLGGTLCLHADGGDPVKVVVLFDGIAGDPERRYDPAELRLLRQAEARAGGAHLGLDDYEFWDYPEGHVPSPEEFEAAADRVAALIASYAPDLVYAPHVGEYHLDHHITARVVRAALGRSNFTGRALGFEVWTPLVAEEIVDISGVAERKLAALREHKTQLEYNDFVHKALGLGAQRSLYLAREARYGEAFRRLLDE